MVKSTVEYESHVLPLSLNITYNEIVEKWLIVKNAMQNVADM